MDQLITAFNFSPQNLNRYFYDQMILACCDAKIWHDMAGSHRGCGRNKDYGRGTPGYGRSKDLKTEVSDGVPILKY